MGVNAVFRVILHIHISRDSRRDFTCGKQVF